MMNLFRFFGGSFFANPSPGILAKNNTKEKTNKCNIWGPLYIPKFAGSVGGQRRRKYHAMKKAFIENLNQIIYTRMYDYGDT